MAMQNKNMMEKDGPDVEERKEKKVEWPPTRVKVAAKILEV